MWGFRECMQSRPRGRGEAMSETERERLGRVAYEAFMQQATATTQERWCDAAAAVRKAVLDEEYERNARIMKASADWEKR